MVIKFTGYAVAIHNYNGFLPPVCFMPLYMLPCLESRGRDVLRGIEASYRDGILETRRHISLVMKAAGEY
jgi:hypothetical protein